MIDILKQTDVAVVRIVNRSGHTVGTGCWYSRVAHSRVAGFANVISVAALSGIPAVGGIGWEGKFPPCAALGWLVVFLLFGLV